MSFIGGIRYLMSGSGLANLLETVYASTAVSHMMSGKALARAVRGHFLVDTALTALIISLVYGIPVPKFESNPDENGDKTICNNDSTDDLHTCQIDIPEIRYPKELEDATDVLNLFLKGVNPISSTPNSIILGLFISLLIGFSLLKHLYLFVVVATRWNDSFDVVELGSDVLLIKPLAKRRF
jgi:hypothetical protein